MEVSYNEKFKSLPKTHYLDFIYLFFKFEQEAAKIPCSPPYFFLVQNGLKWWSSSPVVCKSAQFCWL